MTQLKYRILSSLTLLILDFLWIGMYMGKKYGVMIEKIQKIKMSGGPEKIFYAVLAYSLMVLGLNLFVLPRINTNNVKLKDCLIHGFLFGIILYGVYDFTCAAVLKDWDIKLAFIDIFWGGFVYFISCYLLKFI